jgi:hypothetical protein
MWPRVAPRGSTCIAAALLAATPALAEQARFDLVPEPDVRVMSANAVASAYVVDKKASQFWLCTARFQYRDLTANNGECMKLPADIGRPSLTEAYELRAVTGSVNVSAFLPVFWFIEPASGDV